MSADAFDAYFGSVYGERWGALKQALTSSAAPKHTLHNPFGSEFQDYALDEASLLPAQAMDVQPGERVADFCSAPGGKLLAMLFAVEGQADFVAGDLSPARLTRLKAILHDCVPSDVLARVDLRRGDACLWARKEPESFDKILVDAPCSGERHLLESPKELERWSKKGSERLAIRQHALLCAAVDACKPGGRIVYSTCSVSPIENDGVIEKLLTKGRKGQVEVQRRSFEFGEPTSHGWLAAPDTCAGRGPIYVAILKRCQ